MKGFHDQLKGLLSVASDNENIRLSCRVYLQNRFAMIRLVSVLGIFGLLAGCLATSGSDATDPVAVENPVVFVKRPLLFDEDNGMLIGDNLAEPAAFRPGARLFLKDRASPNATAIDISSSAFGATALYDVKDLNVSFDGTRVLFAMRAPEIDGADEEDQPKWNLWEYDLTESRLTRLIDSDVTAEAGQDIAPAYLPDGRIVFASTRQTLSKGILLDENLGKPQFSGLDEEREVPAFVLHVLDPETQNIDQITFNQSHDLDPLVQDDGTILFSRWDNAGQTSNNGFNLYRVNPDGTELTYIYGRHSHDSVSGNTDVEYLRPRLTDSGRILTALRALESDNFGAIPTTVDIAGFVEANLAVDGSAGSGQSPLVSGLSIGDGISLSGNYGAISPLLDDSNRYLVSWSPCRLRLMGGDGTIVNCTSERIASGNYEAAEPVYGLWLLDAGNQTQRPIERASEGQQFDEAVLIRERPLPDFIQAFQPGLQEAGNDLLADDGYGVLEINSVYDVDGVDTSSEGISQMADPEVVSPDNLPYRFLRLEKPVSIPDETVRDFDNTAFGRSAAQSMREILGYVPIEPDGSVRVAVPANVAFAISVLDAEGQRVGPRHQNWLTVRPGEKIACNGCHNPSSDISHGRPDASPDPVYSGAPSPQFLFPNTQPGLESQEMGDTMARTWAFNPAPERTTRRPTPDLIYEDQWTDPASDAEQGQPITLSYADLATSKPILPSCDEDVTPGAEWTNDCRIVINYEQHIHPLWGVDRGADTCTDCHNEVDAVDMPQVPAAQLDLSDGPSSDEPEHFKAYRELFFQDNEQVLEGGMVVDRTVTEIVLDENGDPELDPNTGDPLTTEVPVPFPGSPYVSTNGARASSDFFDVFRDGGAHAGYLSSAELRLLSEWLDIGGQYYNNPFDAPAD
ncbi:hypothetical protein [Marinobacter sp. CHS3-4]|uniref:HzsA-related protein n=1 Tax=Marinobacter sp. CHS3-4 TaxID=3045174 RepID=UPI0024B5EAD2|nr:hypothetical protein [Marinobacter sp. CHS3-4]MDI9245747.1 hypothetical protein [Marinobacter sp. CHS3-4]